MKYYITSCIVGFLRFDEKFHLIDQELFPEEEISTKITQQRQGNILTEEKTLIQRTIQETNPEDTIIIETTIRTPKYKELENRDRLTFQTPHPAGEYLRSHLDEILETLEIKNPQELIIQKYTQIALQETKNASQDEDYLLIQAINSIDDMDETVGRLIERIREWYAIYFPELDDIKSHDAYIKLITENKTREEIIKNHQKLFQNPISHSNGADIQEEDLEILIQFATAIRSLQEQRKHTEDYISQKMGKIAPNVKDLVGPSLGAKLIAHTGSMKRLATHPSSTVQILGAERAVFRHLKTGEKPPKHGIIYQHPEIRGGKWWIRGKIARTLSLKISLAARKDYFTKQLDPTIKEDFEKRVEQIKKDNPFPKKPTKKYTPSPNTRKKGQKKQRKKGKRNKKKIKPQSLKGDLI